MRTKAKEEILSTLKESENPLTQRQITRKSGLSRPTVRKTVEDLKESGKVEVEQVGNAYSHRRVEDD
jgi:uncharacterized membrane protein